MTRRTTLGNEATRRRPLGSRLQRVQGRAGLVERLEDPLAVIREYLSCCGQFDPAAGSLDELDAGFALERGQLLRYGGRREPERVGDGGDAAAVCELAQDSQARDVEDDVLGHRPIIAVTPRTSIQWRLNRRSQ